MPLYLSVPYRDKDIVKALGARWDGERRQWFAPDGAPPERFARWAGLGVGAPSSAAVAKVQATPTPDGAKGAVSLSSLLFDAAEAVRRALPQAKWILAEVASVKSNKTSGHSYFELVEHDAEGREVAKASARLWASNLRVLRTFEKANGGPIEAGMKILALAQADLSVQYGFGLTIQDIDPSWTLGDMQVKMSKIRQTLSELGIFDKNSQKAPPKDFKNVVVIAPSGAAGLGDFKVEADRLERHGLCHFHYVSGTFEGATARSSLGEALSKAEILAERVKAEALVMIRGGGAKTSLNWLNEQDLAERVCLFPIPVLVGLGHECDSTILDEVACVSFDTPSKVAAGIFGQIVSGASEAGANYDAIVSGAKLTAERAQGAANELWMTVRQLAEKRVSETQKQAELWLAELKSSSQQRLDRAKSNVEILGKEALGLGPGQVLSKGYAMVRGPDGRAIGSAAAAAAAAGSMEITWKDGSVQATVKNPQSTSKRSKK